ncbi:MAG: hypothetical protein IPN59_13825 [Holophaga sp.]|nr:hypothetical protein [Holophaga sp.]
MEPNYASAAHSAPNLVYFNSFDTQSPNSARLHRIVPLDMTKVSDPILKFWMYHEPSYGTSADSVQVQVSTNGGTAWVNAGSPVQRSTGSGWLEHSVNLSAYASQTSLLIGFLGISDYGMDVHLDDISLDPLCAPRSGGLVVGTLTNGDNGLPLSGVSIQNNLGEVFLSASVSDPLTGGSVYEAFSPAGSHVITATRSGYGTQMALVWLR